MAFDTTEKSVEGGQPIELYTFSLGGASFRFNNSDVDVTIGGLVYESEQVSRSDVEASGEDEINSVDITLPVTNDVASRYIAIVPGRRMLVTVYKTHLSEVGATEETSLVFSGFVASAKLVDKLTAVLRCKPESSIFRRSGPRFQYTSLCNHVLYDGGCKLVANNFSFTSTVTAINGDVITVNNASSLGADYFQGGYIEFPVGSGDDFRMVLQQSGDDMRLLLPFESLVVGQQVKLFAGCKHDIATCNAKFSNVINFGGFPYIPRKNPFTTEIL